MRKGTQKKLLFTMVMSQSERQLIERLATLTRRSAAGAILEAVYADADRRGVSLIEPTNQQSQAV